MKPHGIARKCPACGAPMREFPGGVFVCTDNEIHEVRENAAG